MIPFPRPFLLTVEAYHQMREANILTAGDKVELIRGQIVSMSPKGSKHSNAVNRLAKILTRTVGDQAEVHIQNPIELDDHSEPEPDLCLLQPPLDRYEDALPRPADVLLVIEVADSTLTTDRRTKSQLYGEAAIPCYWILNLVDRELEVYEHPFEGGYKVCTRYRPGDIVRLASIGLEWEVGRLLV